MSMLFSPDTVIWTDSSLKVIKRAKLPFSDDDVAVAETIVQEGINLPSGISVDFMGGWVFFYLPPADSWLHSPPCLLHFPIQFTSLYFLAPWGVREYTYIQLLILKSGILAFYPDTIIFVLSLPVSYTWGQFDIVIVNTQYWKNCSKVHCNCDNKTSCVC